MPRDLSLNSTAYVRSPDSRTARSRSGSARPSIRPARSTTWPSPSCSKAPSTRPLSCAAWRRIVARAMPSAHRSAMRGGDRRPAGAPPSGSETASSISRGALQPDDEFRAWARERCARVLRPRRRARRQRAGQACGRPVRLVPQPAPPRHRRLIDGAALPQVAAEYAASKRRRAAIDGRPPRSEPYYPTARSLESFPRTAHPERGGAALDSDGSRINRVTPLLRPAMRRDSSTRSERLTLALDEATSRRLNADVRRSRVS